jgi:hypothetical protein
VVPGITLIFFILKVVPGTTCSSKKVFFKYFLSPKIRDLGNSQKKILNFSSISWGLSTGPKVEKLALFGFSTGIKSQEIDKKIRKMFFELWSPSKFYLAPRVRSNLAPKKRES